MIAATQDFITGAYLLTLRDTFLTRAEVCRLAGWLIAGPDMDMDIDIPPPTILKVCLPLINIILYRDHLRCVFAASATVDWEASFQYDLETES